ncbi:MAG: DUF559 domain-containing protein [Actinomycetota bacterium]|nr:DUF559 domain-containing protein [Actinomycetota bacterium]
MENVGVKAHEEHGVGRPLGRALAELAERQHGVVARWQLTELGLGRGAIEYRVRTGALHRVHARVYAVGHRALGSLGRPMAAALAGGPAALVSHRSAAALWELLPSARSAIDVTIFTGSRRPERGTVWHRSRQTLSAEERALVEGVPVTSVGRTLLDLAETVRPEQLERAVEEAERLRLFDLRALQRLRARSAGRHGWGTLEAVLCAAAPEPEPTRSEMERRFLSLCRRAGVPKPVVNATVGGYEVDAVWPDRRVVVELDSRGFHLTRAAFERDRVRDAALQVAAWRVVRFTWRRLLNEPDVVVETLLSLLQSDQPEGWQSGRMHRS